ncbi:hypothetical protein ACFQZE_10735 [Paenibacillus sp. GCM10027627]|uniref:hypothetical protein n=1 Tax=unclassified Paenibacillus TaxID=185978 RepID=UPI0036277844
MAQVILDFLSKNELRNTRTKAICLAILFLFAFSKTASAETSAGTLQGTAPEPSFSIAALDSGSSSIFMMDSRAGASLSFKVQVGNNSNKSSEFKIYATDVLSTLRGGWSYPASFEPKSLSGTWFKEEVRSGSLKPGEKKVYTFSMNVPQGLKDGQYIGAIVLEEFVPAQMDASESGMSAVSDMYIRLPIQTVININKEKASHELFVENIYHETGQDGLITLFIPHRNAGTILEKPSGTLSLTNSSGKLIKSETYVMDSVYVGTTGLYDLRLTDILAPDTYILTYTTKYQDIETTGQYKFKLTAEEVVSSLDKAENMGVSYKSGLAEILYMYWVWILLIVVVVLGLLLIIVLLLLRRRKEKKSNTHPNGDGVGTNGPKNNESSFGA